MIDFTYSVYRLLIENLQRHNYGFLKFNLYTTCSTNYVVILRHDVDRFPENALRMALLENELGITSTYYFRIIPEVFNEHIIESIASLGHEVGYHYEDVELVLKYRRSEISNNKLNKKELIDVAYENFCKNLNRMRKIADVKTICMHGSPLSSVDNRYIWHKYNYRELGIIGEPYLDIDWEEFGYLTDTGRRWNSDMTNIRDRVNSRYRFDFKKTKDIINHTDRLPSKIMLNVHPHRWFEPGIIWYRELLYQNAKNIIKIFLQRNHAKQVKLLFTHE